MTSLKFSKFNFTAAVDNIYAQFAPVNRGLNSTYIMLHQLFRKYFRYEQMTSLKLSKFNFSAAISIFMRSLRQWVEEFILHISHFNNFSKVLPVCANGVIKNFSAAIGNIYAQVAPVNRELNWVYFMFNNRFRKYFRYAQMRSFIFEMIIGFSAAIRNVYAQLVLMNRGLTSSYIMLIWMLLWDPLTYLFHWGTRVLVFVIYSLTIRTLFESFAFEPSTAMCAFKSLKSTSWRNFERSERSKVWKLGAFETVDF